MRLLAIVIAGAFVASIAHAQVGGAIHGKVVDQDGNAIEGAQISTAVPQRRVVSAEDGTFSLANLPVGTYTLAVRRLGYQPATRAVEVRDGTAVATIALTAIPRELDSVRIRAQNSGMRFMAVVLDQNEQPVTGAEVVAIGINNTIVTDSLGRFAIPKLFKGTLALRIRKMGYAAYSDSYRMFAERSDTLHMQRLATSLSAVEVTEQSGFGNDYWAYREMDQRARWRGAMAAVISREELDALGKVSICVGLPFTPTGTKYGIRCTGPIRFLLNGVYCLPLSERTFFADEVETIEYFPAKSDRSGGLAARHCGPPTMVVWLRKGATHQR